jgi:hypothetical protein
MTRLAIILKLRRHRHMARHANVHTITGSRLGDGGTTGSCLSRSTLTVVPDKSALYKRSELVLSHAVIWVEFDYTTR